MSEVNDGMLLNGAIAPPMANGEVIFEAPWQSRCFGMARALCESGQFDWPDFQAALIRRISERDQRADAHAEPYHYFDHFLAALNDVVVARALLDEQQVTARMKALAARPHGHDH